MKKKILKSINKKTLYIILSLCLFLAGLVTAFVFRDSLTQFINFNKQEDIKTSQDVKNQEIIEQKRSETVVKTSAEAYKVLGNNNIDTDNAEDVDNIEKNLSVVDTIYEEAVVEAKDDNLLIAALLLDQATIYFNNSNNEKALEIAKRAESYRDSEAVVHFIAQVYERIKDYPRSIEYYQKAIALVDKSLPMADENINYYNYKIQSLKEFLI